MRVIEPPQNLELDHVFICTPDRWRDLESLTSAGLTPGPNRVHRGQGTANDCFYFENAYLELLWMNDEEEIRSPVVRPLCLWERIHWRQTAASPFGIAFRPTSGFDLAALETWPYKAAYLPAGRSIPIVSPPGAASETLVFLSMNPLPQTSSREEQCAHTVHRGRPRRITCVAYPPDESMNADRPSRESSPCARTMILELDRGQGEASDLRPALPLTILW